MKEYFTKNTSNTNNHFVLQYKIYFQLIVATLHHFLFESDFNSVKNKYSKQIFFAPSKIELEKGNDKT